MNTLRAVICCLHAADAIMLLFAAAMPLLPARSAIRRYAATYAFLFFDAIRYIVTLMRRYFAAAAATPLLMFSPPRQLDAFA